MHLLLVRHGESTDNVANLYAGSRDAPLTNHGVLQAKRLGDHLVSRAPAIGHITHIFTSNLQRAYKTAEAVANAQIRSGGGSSNSDTEPVIADVTQLTELREKDFGSSEGKRFGSKSNDAALRAAESDAETRDAMMIRANRFIDVHLLPVFEAGATKNSSVLIVAHGIILNSLLRALAARFPSAANEAASDSHAAWSNTGVLQAKVQAVKCKGDTSKALAGSTPDDSRDSPGSQEPRPSTSTKFTVLVQFTNNIDHLSGLKKTRGGIGSAQFDSRQRTMDTFFTSASKKRKAESEADRN
ncbi:phosphoglycerate mutase family protein [Apiospora phragmitis]|uniref:Phosphoglycerate mutase family protein n=1 Tax=Apiospora phragmitis TaxID=2905665 RepID=A0ABR1WVA3_9PEZI